MTTTTIDHGRRGRSRRLAPVLALIALPWACGPRTDPAPDADADAHAAGEAAWSVTAWGDRFEVFPEAAPLVSGATTIAHTHVTRLEDFSPLGEGAVTIVLRGSAGDQEHSAEAPVRPGIFAVAIEPEAPGEVDLVFRIRDAEGTEEIRGGRVRIGTAENPGRLVVAPAPRGGTDGGEPLDFLKEEQWRSEFATAWVRTGRLARSVTGLATIRPPAGGQSLVTATVDGVTREPGGSDSWPYTGLAVDRGAPLFRLHPFVAADRSLPALEAEVAVMADELATARARQARLEELLALEATSQREVEEATLRADALDLRRSAALRDLEAARSARSGTSSPTTGAPHRAEGLVLRAPFAGEVAQVTATPGAAVSAGDPLARVVRTDVVWVEVALSARDAARVAAEGVRGLVLTDPEQSPLRFDESVRLVSIAPEISPRSGTVAVQLEIPRPPGLALGATFEARILGTEHREGIVIPASALVDDGGVSVVYLQLSGESFVRQEVQILERQGDLVLVERLVPGQRLVTRGGDAIRRSSLMATGDAHGHVH